MADGTQLTPDTLVMRLPEVMAAEVDGELVLLSIANSKYYGAEVVGRRIWELIEQPMSLAEVCNTLLDEFEIDRPTCEQEVIAFVNQLLNERLVKVVDTRVDSATP